jgi:hypothetical protein
MMGFFSFTVQYSTANQYGTGTVIQHKTRHLFFHTENKFVFILPSSLTITMVDNDGCHPPHFLFFSNNRKERTRQR